MKIAIIERIENYDEEKPFNKRYYLDSCFKEIFDKLDILLIPNHNLKDQSKHTVKLDTNSFLYDVYKNEIIEVNSYHKQSIKNIAPGFKITAISNDGIIEGIENNNIVAVQWHPEVLYDIKLFKKFIDKFLKNKF